MAEIVRIFGHRIPKRVHDDGNLHYFYWERDGQNKHDYEPIMVISSAEGDIVISRIHWITATVWFSPEIESDKKPAVRFKTPWHTPIIKSNNQDLFLRRRPRIGLIKVIKIDASFRALGILIGTTNFEGDSTSYSNILVTSKVPKERYYFILTKMDAFISIGVYSHKRLPNELKHLTK